MGPAVLELRAAHVHKVRHCILVSCCSLFAVWRPASSHRPVLSTSLCCALVSHVVQTSVDARFSVHPAVLWLNAALIKGRAGQKLFSFFSLFCVVHRHFSRTTRHQEVLQFNFCEKIVLVRNLFMFMAQHLLCSLELWKWHSAAFQSVFPFFCCLSVQIVFQRSRLSTLARVCCRNLSRDLWPPQGQFECLYTFSDGQLLKGARKGPVVLSVIWVPCIKLLSLAISLFKCRASDCPKKCELCRAFILESWPSTVFWVVYISRIFIFVSSNWI